MSLPGAEARAEMSSVSAIASNFLVYQLVYLSGRVKKPRELLGFPRMFKAASGNHQFAQHPGAPKVKM
jgi:hypothetical protein